MNIQTIVYDEDVTYAKSIVMDLCNTSAVTACTDGDAIEQRDEALLWEQACKEAAKVAHLYSTGQGMLAFINSEYQRLLLNHRDKKKEPIGS